MVRYRFHDYVISVAKGVCPSEDSFSTIYSNHMGYKQRVFSGWQYKGKSEKFEVQKRFFLCCYMKMEDKKCDGFQNLRHQTESKKIVPHPSNHREPYSANNLTMFGTRFLPRHSRKEPRMADTLILALWYPEHKIQLSPLSRISDLENYELTSSYCFKHLSLS